MTGVVIERLRTEPVMRDCLQEVVKGEPAELMSALVVMEDAQASFQILRLSAASCLSPFLVTVPPSNTQQVAVDKDASVK